ncbi:LysR family transcriptional regulator substrate-binding protein [Corynebacterium sp. Q4381]|uniref:LysR family transcriptional regulator substrate-binding protein n=1 Tax=Corynebacterium sp. Marseille-Q4381 TaxID=3121597 RepID=UPI002FE6BD5A
MLTIAFATGTAPGKWFRRYEELTGIRLTTIPSDDPFSETCDLALVRLPDARVGEDHHVVRLYEEALGVAVPKDSEIDPADAGSEIVNYRFDPAENPSASADALHSALQVVAANVGVAFAPLPLLKALSKKQVQALEYPGPSPATEIALVWLKVRDDDDIQDFVGVAKGRTVRSSRSNAQPKQSRNRKRIRHPR